MAQTISRIDRVPVDYDVTATDAQGQPLAVTSIHVALLPPRASVTGDTTWTTLPVIDGVLTVVYAGPDADVEPGDLAVPVDGGWAHRKWVDGTYVDAEKLERIVVS